MNYMTPQEAAKKWGVSVRRVQFLCTNNRIPDIQFINHRWLIPVNAIYPQYSNKKNNKSNSQQGNYHFPLYLYSDYYPTNRELNDVERQILKAQILMAQGGHIDSLQLCHKLEKQDMSLPTKFGLYCTIVHASLPLGLYGVIQNYINLMEEICTKDSAHEADYRLLIAICKFQYTYNTLTLRDIDVSKLSPQALISYECFSMQVSVYSNTLQSEMTFRICEALCRNLEIAGNLPSAFISHSFLALFYGRADRFDEQEKHIKLACQIGCNLKLYGLLTKYSSLNPELYGTYIAQYDSDFAPKLEHLRKDNQTKWRMVYNYARGSRVFPNCSPEDADFLMVLTYNVSNKTIAKIKNVPLKEVTNTIERLCVQYGFQNKRELVAYAKNIFSSIENQKLTVRPLLQ